MVVFAWPVVAQSASDREVRGRVVDVYGRSVSNAVVSVRAVTRTTGTRYGVYEDVDATARTGGAGEFVIRGRSPFVAVTVNVEAAGFAKGAFSQLTSGELTHELKLLEGSSVTGRLVKDGKAVAGVVMGLSDTERGSEIFLLNVSAATDSEGRFLFTNVPPRRTYFLFGRMESLRDRGALPWRKINVGTNESVLDVGVLNLEAGFVLEGTAPAKTKVVLGRDGPRDLQEVVSDGGGRFHFSGVPREVASVAATVAGKRLSLRNGSLFPGAMDQLLGRIFTNKTDLILGFEEGTNLAALNVNPYLLREEALRGVEKPGAFPGAWEISGKVEEAAKFSVTEGRVVGANVEWFPMRVSEWTNGAFQIFVAGRELASALLIEAEGFAPEKVVAVGSTNFVVRLKSGWKPRGIILRPNGSRATNAMVYLTDTNAAVQMEGPPLKLIPFHNAATREARTDGEGRFEFAAREGDSAVMAVDEAGFATVSVEELRARGEVRLQAWARVEGKLMIADAPATNEVVRLVSMPSPYEWYPRELPGYSISLRTRTEADGEFVFERVPPLMMELSHSPMLSDKAPEPIEKTQNRRLLLKPGETRRVQLGGVGRPVIGKIVVEGYAGPINWNSPAIAMESIDEDAPSAAGLTNMLARLQANDEAGYQKARREYAMANRNYYGSEKGLERLLEERRYLLQFGEDGVFAAYDVPAGKYRVRWVLKGKRKVVTDAETVIEVKEGPAGSPREPMDLGEIRLRVVP
jgi:hypothetical protein